jgi:hypothetical protein
VTALETNPRVRHDVERAWATWPPGALVNYLRGQAQIDAYSAISLEIRWLSEVASVRINLN